MEKQIIIPETVGGKMELAMEILQEVMRSNYIPMTSPSPSSSEAVIKHAVIDAVVLLEKAVKMHNSCYTLRGL